MAKEALRQVSILVEHFQQNIESYRSPAYNETQLRREFIDPHQSAIQMRGGYFSYESRFIRNLPIRTINFSVPDDKARHDRVVNLVEQMLSLHKQLVAAKTPDEKIQIQRQIDATDQQIDRLVYELYGLTEKEIQIVEEGTK